MTATGAEKAMSESRFYMWRAVFAMAHADEVVTAEEREILRKILQAESFLPEQRAVLEADIETAQDIGEMFSRISDQQDRADFFRQARRLVWCDGDFAGQEQKIMQRLERAHVRSVDMDALVGTVDLSFEEEPKERVLLPQGKPVKRKAGFFDSLLSRLTGRR